MKRMLRLSGALLALVGCGPNDTARTDLTLSVPYEVTTLDPHGRDRISEFAILSHLYEPLVRADDNLGIRPWLAESWENPDASTWIFQLRDDVFFRSGKQLTSADVLYSFERILGRSDLEMKLYLGEIIAIEATDGMTVRIETRSPSGAFLNQLNFILVVPAGTADQELVVSSNGSGPFELVDFRGEEIVLRRNEGYWGPRASFESVTFRLGRSPKSAWTDLIDGTSQFSQVQSRALTEGLRASAEYRVQSHEGLFTKYLSFDLERQRTPYCDVEPNPFLDERVRRAIHLAIDRVALIDDLDIEATPASQPVPQAVLGYNPDIRVPVRDLEQARDLLDAAGFENGFSVRLQARKILASTAFLIRDQLAEIEIVVDVEAIDDAEFFVRQEQGDFSFFLSRLGSPTGDAGGVIERAFHSRDESGSYGSFNWVGYSSPELDAAIEESQRMTSIEHRRDALQAISATVMQDLPWIPLYVDHEVYAFVDELEWRPRNDSYVFAHEIVPRR